MRHIRSISLSLLVLAAVAAAIAGCGGGNSNQATAATGSGGSGTIGVSNISGLGKVLVDSQGRTLYLFEKDTTSKSMCSGACATEWPPLTTSGKPTAGGGVTKSMLGTTKRSDGTAQVTYNGHPLYTFSADKKAGDATGQHVDAFGAEWYVLSTGGSKVQGKATGSGGSYAY